MNPSPSELRESAFRLLGIKDETQFKVIAELVKTPTTSGKELPLTPQLIAIAPILATPDYLNRFKQKIPFPVSDEIIEAAHAIYENELGQLISHPDFLEAREKLQSKMTNNQAIEENNNQEELQPIANVGEVTAIPFLMGHKPPYIPVLKVAVTSEKNRVLWSEMMHWFDQIFVSRALLAQVSEHAQNSQEMIKSGMINLIEESKIKSSLSELRATLDDLEKALLPAEGSGELGSSDVDTKA